MSIWLEIHCDIRAPTPKGMIRLDPFCHGEAGNFVGQLADNTQESVRRCLKNMEKETQKRGWIKDRRGWVCPNCKTVIERK